MSQPLPKDYEQVQEIKQGQAALSAINRPRLVPEQAGVTLLGFEEFGGQGGGVEGEDKSWDADRFHADQVS